MPRDLPLGLNDFECPGRARIQGLPHCRVTALRSWVEQPHPAVVLVLIEDLRREKGAHARADTALPIRRDSHFVITFHERRIGNG